MTLFFLNPDRSYYLRELERRLECSPGILARELKAFSEEGLLDKEAKANLVYYRINPKHPLFEEIKGIVQKTSGVPKRLSEVLQKTKEVEEAYLYGSFAGGKTDANSDIDLLLVGKETDALSKVIKKLEIKFGRAINAVVYGRKEFDDKRSDPSEFLCQVMKSTLIQLKPSDGSAQSL